MALQAARQLSIGQWLGAIGAMLGVVWIILVFVVPVLNLIQNPEPGIGIYIALPFMISFMSIPGILLVVFGARLVAQRNEVRITRFVGAS